MFAQLRPGRWVVVVVLEWSCWSQSPALILVLLIFAKLQCVRIFSVGGGEGREDCGGGLVVFVTPHSVVVVPPSHSHSLPPPRGFHLVKTHRFLV